MRGVIGWLTLLIVSLAAEATPRVEFVCTLAPSQSKLISGLTGAAGGSAASLAAIGSALGLSVVPHSSGAAILSGASGYIAGTLGGAGVAPVIVTIGVTVTGAMATVELLCAPKNHPELVAAVQSASEEFARRFRIAVAGTNNKLVDAKTQVAPVVDRASIALREVQEDVFAYAYRVLER